MNNALIKWSAGLAVIGFAAALTFNAPRVGAAEPPSTPAAARSRDYRFDRTISREVLENYLSRSISMEGVFNGQVNLDDNVRMLSRIGAKYIGRSLCLWGAEANFITNVARAKAQVPKMLAADPDTVLETLGGTRQLGRQPDPGQGQCGRQLGLGL